MSAISQPAVSVDLASIPAAHTYSTRSPATTNPIDDFFGCSLSTSSTRESRHDRRISDVPPPYMAPPEYSRTAEPITLAMFLFKFGFLFPPFWILGVFILFSPLRAPSTEPGAWLPEKTDAERQAVIEQLRKAEMKWAWRCLLAICSLLAFALALGLGIWGINRAFTHQ